MILVRKPEMGKTYVFEIEPTYHETREGMAIPREERAWKFKPKRGNGTKSHLSEKGVAAIAKNLIEAEKLIAKLGAK